MLASKNNTSPYQIPYGYLSADDLKKKSGYP